jgi:hypothetical protein
MPVGASHGVNAWVAKENRKLAVVTQNAIATCLGKISDTVVRRNQATPDVSAATDTCLAQFFALGRSDGRSAADKMKAKVLDACDPAGNAHEAGAVLGGGDGTVQQPLAALDLDAYCGAFAAGSRTVADWIDCLRTAAECQARQQIAVDFPRGLEWLALMAAEFATSRSDRAADAQAALARIDTALEGATDDDRPEIACGPVGAEGAIPVGQTPPAPAATCSDPASPISLAIEAQTAARQAEADAARALGRLGDERNETLTKDIRTYHIDVAELGQLAEAAGVATLVLTHQVPALDGGLAETFFRAPIEAMYGGTLVVADDGDRITIPIE